MASAKNPIGSLGKPTDASQIAASNPLDVQSQYANFFGFGFTSTDVRLIFAEVGADVVSNRPSKILKGNIVLPLHSAAFLATSLAAAIEEHQKSLRSLSENAAKSL